LGDSPQDVRFFNRPGVFSLDYDVEVHRAREPFADLVQTDARLGIRVGEMEVIYVDHNAAHADGADHNDYRGQDVERSLVRRGPAPDAFQQFDHSAAKPDAEPDRAFAQQYQRRRNECQREEHRERRADCGVDGRGADRRNRREDERQKPRDDRKSRNAHGNADEPQRLLDWGWGRGEWGVGSGEWRIAYVPRFPTPDSPPPTPHSPPGDTDLVDDV